MPALSRCCCRQIDDCAEDTFPPTMYLAGTYHLPPTLHTTTYHLPPTPTIVREDVLPPTMSLAGTYHPPPTPVQQPSAKDVFPPAMCLADTLLPPTTHHLPAIREGRPPELRTCRLTCPCGRRELLGPHLPLTASTLTIITTTYTFLSSTGSVHGCGL